MYCQKGPHVLLQLWLGFKIRTVSRVSKLVLGLVLGLVFGLVLGLGLVLVIGIDVFIDNLGSLLLINSPDM